MTWNSKTSNDMHIDITTELQPIKVYNTYHDYNDDLAKFLNKERIHF